MFLREYTPKCTIYQLTKKYMQNQFFTECNKTLLEKGVLVGADRTIEWLLPWWWQKYILCNTLPVAFVDFGLTDAVKKFCEERGILIPLDSLPPEVFACSNPEWAKSYGPSYEKARQGLFKKPLALMKSPFEITLWTDLDCEILKSLDSLFSLAKESSYLSLAREVSDGNFPYPIYNGGVILYRKGNPILQEFAEKAVSDAKHFWGDDRLLSFLIDRASFSIDPLPSHYNWRISQGVPAGAAIIHWVGEWGKNYIKTYGGISSLL